MPKSVLLIVIVVPLIAVVVLTAVIRERVHTKQKMLLTAAIGGLETSPRQVAAGVPGVETFNIFAKRFVGEFQKRRRGDLPAGVGENVQCSLGKTEVAEVEGSIFPIQASAEVLERGQHKKVITFRFAYLKGKWVAMGGSDQDDSGKWEFISRDEQQKMIDAMGE